MNRTLLELAGNPKSIKHLSAHQLEMLAEDVRSFMLESVSKTGGHLAASLGAVELTIALLKCFDVPLDRIVWDVGH